MYIDSVGMTASTAFTTLHVPATLTLCIRSFALQGLTDLSALSNMLSEGEKMEEQKIEQDRVARMGPVCCHRSSNLF